MHLTEATVTHLDDVLLNTNKMIPQYQVLLLCPLYCLLHCMVNYFRITIPAFCVFCYIAIEGRNIKVLIKHL